MEREVGGGIGMGKTCKLKDVSFQKKKKKRQRENLQDIQGIHKDYIERNKTKGKFIRLLLRNYENQETMDSWSKSPPFKGLSFFLKPTVNSTSFDNSFEEGR